MTLERASWAGTVGGLSLATVGDTEYFSVVAPAGATGRLSVTAAAGGVSLLSPRVTLFDGAGRPTYAVRRETGGQS